MKGIRLYILMAFVAVFALQLSAEAQQMPRGKRMFVRGGKMERVDTLGQRRDSMRYLALCKELDSLQNSEFKADSTELGAMRTDDIHTLDSLVQAQIDQATLKQDTTKKKTFKKGWFMSDSMSLSKVCWMSTVVPGYGQIYNKQYWKLPILYGTLATGLALYINENKTYKPLKRAYEAYTNVSTERTPELDALQSKMIRSNTRRQIYLGATLASYIYFIGDAAINKKTNDVSHVKKATTLACIFPGAGQIYNKSYWKVPFVVGGFASMIYCIDWNNRGYKRFKKAYALVADYEAHPEKYPDGPRDEFKGRYSTTFIRDLRNNYRRNRDLCIIVTGALYVLQIVDAHVDAHLRDYDISDDLSMNLEPLIDYTFVPKEGNNRPIFGFNLNVKF